MKIIITQGEAVEKGIWGAIMLMFGITEDSDDIWINEQFILTEEQAKQLGLIH
ncbi:hypothetical protein J2T12_002114 [Paenibacillus anaericanus]|uniref:hypothetical protein n=1 Tax=Paenibacillus TaxID=44249 RepID=UPI001477045E|nr:hypothetical protein [Paenibacillus anaericanus]MDQ0088704.1 hypothetical protein [Paenibacillus anaericanus]